MLKKQKRRSSPRRILLWAIALSAICGAIAFGEPLEDALRGARNWSHLRPADGRVVVVTLDDRTLDRIGLTYSEEYDAQVIENLMAKGVNRVYFDRAFHDIHNEAGSAKLIETLKRFPGRVFVGAIRNYDPVRAREVMIEPDARYLPYAKIASLVGRSTPFELSAETYYADRFNTGVAPSISASIAGKTGPAGEAYRPDWTIDAASVPTLSFSDVLRKDMRGLDLRGKDVIVGPDSLRIPDAHHVLAQGWVPGVFFHVIGAQTLREGHPTKPSWMLPWSVALLLSVLVIRARRKSSPWGLHAGAALLCLVAPFVTDYLFMTVDYVPAMLLYWVVAFRTHNHAMLRQAKHENVDSRLPNLAAFRETELATGCPVAALNISNYNAILNAFPHIDAADIVEAIARPIRMTALGREIYHDDNTLYWTLPSLSHAELQGHLDGLLKLIRSIAVGDAVIDVDCALGIDYEFTEPAEKRATAAKIAANAAAARGVDRSVYKAEPSEAARWRLSQMSELDQALARGELSMVYQPQIDLHTGRFLSAEALVRWHHPVKGFISPAEFIVQAEQSNRIGAVTWYVLEKVLTELAPVFAGQPDFEVAVNLSARLLTDDHLVSRVAEALQRHRLAPANLKMEITETAALQAGEEVATNIARFAELGVAISIDDYGTGNATLDYLQNLTFHELKIDRQFVVNVTRSERDRVLVASTISLAHALGHKVIAEGIETEEAARLLKKLGCDRLQGYHIARPMPIDQLMTILEENSRHNRKQGKSGLAYG
ncbi:MAG: EAL domain-containing protein [Sphingomonadales bacterium]|nr:EAL domain-containing protein [Sphingomonadales bacterium]